MSALRDYLPRGNTLSDEAWNRRHLLLQWLLLLHVPGLFIFGLARGYRVVDVAETVAVPFALLVLGRLMRTRRLASFFITAGLVFCSAALVGLSGGTIEAHFHFFIMIGFIALYQDWVPFLWNIVFTVLSHGFGSAFRSDLIFNHHAGIAHPWTWSVLHGVAVLAACVGVVLFWKQTEDEQNKTIELRGQLAAGEIARRRFTADLLVNLARRNQNLLYRQLDLLNQLEENERDPDALADLFRLDHLATRIRRNAESLLVLSGEEPARKWGRPVLLADVARAAIAETEDLDRVDYAVDDSLAVSGRAVADLTHLVAELIENAVHFSPPGVGVMVRTRPFLQSAGAQVLTIEDWGVGMSAQEVAEANRILDEPREVDLSMSQRLGLHVVARLAQRYAISVSLTQTPGGGVTAVVIMPAGLFDIPEADVDLVSPRRATATRMAPVAMAAQATATRTVTVAPLMAPRPLSAAPVPPPTPPAQMPAIPAVPVPAVPPMPASQPVTVAARLADQPDTSDTWHSWWTPHQEPNGTSTQDTGGPGRGAESAAPAPPRPGQAQAAGSPTRVAGDRPARSPVPDRPVGPPAPPTSARTAGAAGPGGSAGAPGAAGRPDGGTRPGATAAGAAGPVRAPGPAAGPAGPSTPAGAAGQNGPSGARDSARPASPTGTVGRATPGAGTSARPAGGGALAAESSFRTGKPAGAEEAGPRLSQRVPQANLAEGLRRTQGPSGPPPQPLRDPEQAREALSRFQASQRMARALLDEGSIDDSGNRNGSGGADEGRT